MEGDTIGKFPNHFLKIHSSGMTDKQENDAFFKEHSKEFIQLQKLIYQDPKNAKQHFNASIDACIKCHEVKCGVPIYRIKKLYTKQLETRNYKNARWFNDHSPYRLGRMLPL